MIAPSVDSHKRAPALIGLGAVGCSLVTALYVQQFSDALLVLVPIGVCIGLAIMRWPWIAGLLLVASVPVQQVGAVGAGGGTLTATRACLVVVCGAMVLWWMVLHRGVVLHPGMALFGLLLFALLASAQLAENKAAATSEITRWVIAFAAFAALLQFFGDGDPRRALWLACTVVAITGLEALYGVAQGARAIGPASFLIGGGLARAFGTFGRPNTFAGFLEFGAFLGLSLGLWFGARAIADLTAYRVERLRGYTQSGRVRRRLAQNLAACAALFACAALAMFGIVASFSRGAWLGTVAGLLVFAVLLGPRIRLALVILAPCVVLMSLSGLADRLPGSVSGRLGSITDVAHVFDASTITITNENFAAVERMAHWQAGWHMFEDHPMLGIGAGNFNSRYPEYYVREEFRFSQGHAHNYYIHILAENGVVGLMTYLMLLGTFVALALRVTVSSPAGLARSMALGCLTTLVSLSIHNLFENLHVLNLGIMYSAIWCLIVASHRMWRGTGTFARIPRVACMEYSRA